MYVMLVEPDECRLSVRVRVYVFVFMHEHI